MIKLICLSIAVYFVSLKALSEPNKIYIAKGTNGKSCYIPFVYKGNVYHDCITIDSNKPWCYIDKNFKDWEYCIAHPKEYDGCRIANPNITLAEVEEILYEHNSFRSKMPALKMRKLKWNSELAQKAQLAANLCKNDHVEINLCGQRKRVGQNLFSTSSQYGYPEMPTWKYAISHWTREQSDYNIKTGKCREAVGEKIMCGHYKAVVWAETSLVGCGKAFCNEDLNGKTSYSIQYICNYYEPGNVGENVPYIESTKEKCQDCHLFDSNEKFRCDKDQLCETCDNDMEGCVGTDYIGKLVSSGKPCQDTYSWCEMGKIICDQVKEGTKLPELIDFVNNCKKTCGECL